mgnify:CR=1 FL=1
METYRLAVCVDEDRVRKDLCSLCGEILAEEGIAYEITEFASAGELEKKLEERSDLYDLLLLDICMDSMTGMELARSIRQRRNHVDIIFVTGDESYALEGYGVQPLHFLLKPVGREALAEALHTALALGMRRKNVYLQLASRIVRLPLHEIHYIESYNHHVIIHRGSECENSYLISLTEVERQLPGEMFCRCHNSYLVNLEYVEEITRTKLLLRDGCRLPVGRAYYDSLQHAFIHYMNL